jgi:hypothetical protein
MRMHAHYLFATKPLLRAARAIGPVLLVAVWCSGCVAPDQRLFSVAAQADSTLNARPASFVIESGNAAVPASSPQFDKVVACVRAALESRGMFEAPSGVSPHQVVFIDYVLGPPTVETRVRQTQVPVEIPCHTAEVIKIVTNADGSESQVKEQATVPASTEWANVDVPYTVTVYTKTLQLTAMDAATRRTILWEVSVENTDEDNDLDALLPLLVAAAMDAIGTDQSAPALVLLGPGDERVRFVTRDAPTG